MRFGKDFEFLQRSIRYPDYSSADRKDMDDYISLDIDTLIERGAFPQEIIGPSFELHTDSLMSSMGFYVQRSSTNKGIEDSDPDNDYRSNSWGCRDDEYTEAVDILAAGCSMTFGQGVPEETRWSSVLGKSLGMSVATIAIPGWSTQAAISAVMNYIMKFGKPKIIALYLPDFWRMDYITNYKQLTLNENRQSTATTEKIRLVYSALGHVRETPQLSKKPHKDEDVLNPEFTHFLAGQSLRFLIEYCKEANIKLMYGSWDVSVGQYIRFMKRLQDNRNSDTLGLLPELDLSGYTEMYDYHENNEDLSHMDCHQELKQKYEKYFDWGTDRDGHIGVHMHAHVAEIFEEKLNSL